MTREPTPRTGDHTVGSLARDSALPLDAAIARGITRSYILALVLFALAAVATAAVLQDTMAAGRTDAARLNLVERLEKDLTRAGLLAHAALEGEPGAADTYVAVVARVDRMSRALLEGGMGAGRPLEPGFRDLPLEGANGLAEGLMAFVAQARALGASLRTAPDAAAVDAFEARHATAIKPALDGLSEALAIEAAQRMGEMSWRHLGAVALVLVLLLAEAVVIFRPMVLRTRRRIAELERMALRDVLTGLPNRRAFMEEAARQARLDRRSGQHSALLLIDLDRFKQVNDRHGHAAGDAALRRFAAVAAATLRDTDTVARLGGEEFAVLLHRTDGDQAVAVAEKLRQAVAADEATDSPPFTVSIGVTTLAPDEAIEAVLQRADRGLYRAKAGGRNRVVSADPVPVVPHSARLALGRWRRLTRPRQEPAGVC